MESLTEEDCFVAGSCGEEPAVRRAAAQAGEFWSIGRNRAVAVFSSNREFWLLIKISSDLS